MVVRAPPVPHSWEALADRVVVDLTVTSAEQGVRREIPGLAPGAETALRLPKETVSLITATFRVPAGADGTGTDRAFRSAPAGAVVPHHLAAAPGDADTEAGTGTARGGQGGHGSHGGHGGHGGTVEPRLRWGRPVSVLRRAADAGLDLSRFNVGRFLDRCREVADGQPWAIAEEPILDTLREGRFRETAIRLAALHTVDVAAPPGRWVPANPALPSVSVEPGAAPDGDDPGALLPGRPVPAGIYRFLEAGSGEALHIYVDGEGEVLSLRVPP